jgi:hypothetical protein
MIKNKQYSKNLGELNYYRGQGFLAVVSFGSPRPPPPSSPLQSPVELSDGGGDEGMKEEPNQTTARKPGPL